MLSCANWNEYVRRCSDEAINVDVANAMLSPKLGCLGQTFAQQRLMTSDFGDALHQRA